MYNFLNKDESIQISLQKNFQVQIKDKTFNNGLPYLLINLPSKEEEKLFINSEQMTVVEHHYTMPQKKDENTNSLYHYTLILKDSENQQYKTHLYFDKLDRIVVEPKLLIDENFILMKPDDIKTIYAFSLATTPIISFIRGAQKEAIKLLIKEIESKETHLAILSKHIASNKSECIALIEDQIHLLESLESLEHLSRKKERKFYEYFLQKLNEIKCDTNTDEKFEEESAPIQKENIPEKTIVQRNKPIAKKINHHRKTLRNTKKSNPNLKTKQPKSNPNLINACKNTILKFEQSPNHPNPELIKDMIDQVVLLNSNQLFSTNTSNDGLILEIKTNLSTQIRGYCNRFGLVDTINNELYFSALKANIITLNDIFIIEMIKQDNEALIQKMLNVHLITDSTKIKLNDKSNYTLVEWCVYFNATKCFKFLLNNKFSLDYLDEENSPFLLLLTNCAKTIKFSSFLTPNASDILKLRLLEILKKKEKSACKYDIGWIKVKKQQIDILEKISACFRTYPRCKYIELAQIDFNNLNPLIMEAYLYDTPAQKAYLGILQHIYNNIKTKTSLDGFITRQRMLKLNGYSVTGSINQWVRRLNLMSVEDAVCDIAKGLNEMVSSADHTNLPITTAFNNLMIVERDAPTVISLESSNNSSDPTPLGPKNL